MEQPTLEGMPRRLYPCTPTRLASWLDCPRRYRMTYLDRPPPPRAGAWAHNTLGAVVHTALRALYEL
ncbi:MAG TPA: PD-(D/E)XK nuclease family protein, partial [Streptosporangiaceae bacterium]